MSVMLSILAMSVMEIVDLVTVHHVWTGDFAVLACHPVMKLFTQTSVLIDIYDS